MRVGTRQTCVARLLEPENCPAIAADAQRQSTESNYLGARAYLRS